MAENEGAFFEVVNEESNEKLDNNEVKKVTTSFTNEQNQEKIDNTEINSINISNVQLSSRSRNLLVLRILVLCLACIYIPMDNILSNKLIEVENNYLLNSISIYIPTELRNGNLFFQTSRIILAFLGDKDYTMLYCCILYMIYHPFLALKIVFVTHSIEYAIVLMRCLYQSIRPFWHIPQKDDQNRFCLSSFGNPSIHHLFASFFYLYAFLSFRVLNKKQNKLTIMKKLISFFIVFSIIFINGFFLFVNKLNYICQLCFAMNLSLTIICVLLDFETKIHNYILKALKNGFKTRKYKIRIFLVILALNVLSVIIFFFIIPDSLNLVEENIFDNQYCSQDMKQQLGLRKTFLEITYINGIIGAFWGASLTVECDCGKWWASSRRFMMIKVLLTIIIGLAYILPFKMFNTITYEFDFLVNALKYFVFYYVMMGFLPIIFDKMNLNEKTASAKSKSVLFTRTIFSDLAEDKKEQSITLLNEDIPDGKRDIFKKSIIIKDLTRQAHDEKLEFLVKESNENIMENANDTNNNENGINNSGTAYNFISSNNNM